jgi:malonyl-CoA/methylmalonyl-CoA synthetase
MTLLSLFDKSLIHRASKQALDFNGKTYTFGELEDRSNRLAQLLIKKGLKQGDRLSFFLQNRVDVIDLWIAGVKLGLVIVPVNVLYRERELKHILSDASPTALITSKDMASWIPQGITIWDVDQLATEASHESSVRIENKVTNDTPLSLIYTSGTTGASKGAVLTQGNFLANGHTLVSDWQFTDKDRYLATLPLFHVHGLGNGIHCWLMSGCHMRLTERFEHAHAQAWFEEYKPTVFFGVPAMFIRLLEIPEVAAKAIGLGLRLAVSGSAPLPAEIHEKFRAKFGSVILERYGMTETLMNVSNPYLGERRPGTVGLPLKHVETKICDEAGQLVGDNITGELWVKGPNVCSGYWGRPEATAQAWIDGWFKTGDIAIRAADGYITLQGRRSDLIISGGFNIYPREIEELLLEQPGIKEATVVGVADPIRGEVPVAYIVADVATWDETALRPRLASQLASFKLPKAFVRVDALPRTALGKVQKHLLPPLKS